MLQAEEILQKRYQLKEKVGVNPARQTWLANDLQGSSHKTVIIKLLAFNPQMQWEELKLFEREATVLKNIHHPRIPKYLDYFSLESGGAALETSDPKDSNMVTTNLNRAPWFALVQEYIPGTSLNDQLERGKKFSEQKVVWIAKQVLTILIYLHEISPPILHRDIKPSNLVLGEDNNIYLVDFGAVQDKAKAEGATFTVVGTSGYAPPEQLWGKAVPSSDLYALGATLIHLLTGIPPAELPHRGMQIQFRDRITLDPSFARWMERLLQPAPERRFSTGREAFDALHSISYNESKKENSFLFKSSILKEASKGAIASGIIYFLLVLVMPSLFIMSNNARKVEGRSYTDSINRSQLKFYSKNKILATSIENLGVKIPKHSENYNYSIKTTDETAFHYAVSRYTPLKSYVGGVFVLAASEVDANAASDEMSAIAILCETNLPGKTTPPAPILQEGKPACAEGTRQLY